MRVVLYDVSVGERRRGARREMEARMSESKMRPASEIAAEIVPEPRENSLGFWEFWIKSGLDDDDAVVIEGYSTKAGAELDADVLRGIIAGLIERARFEGAVEVLRSVDGDLGPMGLGKVADKLTQLAPRLRR